MENETRDAFATLHHLPERNSKSKIKCVLKDQHENSGLQMTERSEHNIAKRSADERERVNIDLAASGVAYKERMNKPVLAAEVELQQPEKWRENFRERLAFYRNAALQFPRGNDPVYAKPEADK